MVVRLCSLGWLGSSQAHCSTQAHCLLYRLSKANVARPMPVQLGDHQKADYCLLPRQTQLTCHAEQRGFHCRILEIKHWHDQLSRLVAKGLCSSVARLLHHLQQCAPGQLVCSTKLFIVLVTVNPSHPFEDDHGLYNGIHKFPTRS